MMHKAWSSIEEVPYCFSRSSVKFQGHMALKFVEFDPNWAFPDCNSSFNSPMAMKCCTKLETAKGRCPIVFQGHPSNFRVTRDKTSPILTQIGRFWTIGQSQLSNPSDLPCLWNRGNSLHSIRGRQFFAKSAHRDSLCSCSLETIFREINSSLPVNAGWNTCCAMGSHARWSIDTFIVSQSRDQLIQCQCKSRLQTAKLGINKAFNQIIAVWPRCLHPPSCPSLRQFRSKSSVRDWWIFLWRCMHTKIRQFSWCQTIKNRTTNLRNNSNVGLQPFYRHRS